MPPAHSAESTLMHKTLRLAAIWVATWALLLLPDLLLYWSGYPVVARQSRAASGWWRWLCSL